MNQNQPQMVTKKLILHPPKCVIQNVSQPVPTKPNERFFEIEDLRSKRVHKGQTQYLIKWRGWPETANTWEPIENLQACLHVVNAFEESLQLGSRDRKRKRKGTFTQPKKTQDCTLSSNVSTGSWQGRKLRSLKFPSIDSLRPSIHRLRDRGACTLVYSRKKRNGKNEGEVKIEDGDNVDMVTQQTENENGCPKVYELRERISTDNLNSVCGKVSVDFSDTRSSDMEEVQNTRSNRFTGANSRKSRNVRRFKKKEGDKFEVHEAEDGEGPREDDAGDHRKVAWLSNPCSINKNIKSIDYSASMSNNVQDVCVTSVAIRGNEKEDEEGLHMAVKHKSKVLLLEDRANKERKLEVIRMNEQMLEACEAVVKVRSEVDDLSEKVSELGAAVHRGEKVPEKDLNVLGEFLMRQVLKLDGIQAEGEAKVQRRLEVLRVLNLVDTVDNLKSRNADNISSDKVFQTERNGRRMTRCRKFKSSTT